MSELRPPRPQSHASCVACWNEGHLGRAVSAASARYTRGRHEVCCFCGKDTSSGIYLVSDDADATCHASHEEWADE